MIGAQYLVASMIIVTHGVGDGAVISTSAVVFSLSNLDFFFFFILPPPCSFNENPFLARALLAENSIWNPSRKLTLLEPTPFPSSEFLLIAIWLFLVSSSLCWVQAGEVHPAEGVGLCEL